MILTMDDILTGALTTKGHDRTVNMLFDRLEIFRFHMDTEKKSDKTNLNGQNLTL